MSKAGAGNPRRAIVLAAAMDALWESLGLSISVGFWDALLERYLEPARKSLGDGYDAVRAEGLALAFDDAVELALPADRGPAGGWCAPGGGGGRGSGGPAGGGGRSTTLPVFWPLST